jgi:hypothetical protein
MSLSDLRELDVTDELCRLQDKIAALTIERDGLHAALVAIVEYNRGDVAARRALAKDGE